MDNESPLSTEALVCDYLDRMLQASKALSYADNDAMDMEGETSNRMSPNGYINAIAQNLLAACSPEVLSLGVSHLPTLNIFDYDESIDLLLAQEIEEDDDIGDKVAEITRDRFYQHRRTDYLRRLLRLMAPVAMEVCATILSNLLSSSQQQSESNGEQPSLAGVILLAHWLPVSPHLSTMACEFFSCLQDPIKSYATIQTSDTVRLTCDFIVAEALFGLTLFYKNRREIGTLRRFGWDWTSVFGMLHRNEDVIMNDSSYDSNGGNKFTYLLVAIKWYAVRILSQLMDWKNGIAKSVLEKWNLESDNVPWRIHPWEVDQEEVNMEQAFVQRFATLWDSSDCFPLPTSSDIQFMTDSTPHLARVGEGIAFFKSDSFRQIRKIASMENGARETREAEPFQMIQSTRLLVPTATTCRNLSLLGAAMCQEPHPPPILICGPHGSGKSSLARELLRLCRPHESLMEFHIDEETDSKTLIGSYTTTDIPGEFAWRAGALTRASREGRWILIEELDGVPVEIQAALVKVFEERMLPLGNGKYERCHPDFRIFATCTTTKPSIAQSVDGEEGASLRIGRHKGGGKQILNPSYWRKVHVKPLPFSELNEVAASVYPSIPRSVVESAMVVLRTLDCSGRSNTGGSGLSEHSVGGSDISRDVVRLTQRWTGGRVPTVRDLFKLLSRIASGICFERDVTFTTEAQRTLCMAESIDIFVGSCAERDVKNDFISLITAPAWGISRDFALKYMNARKPEVVSGSSFYEIGRAKIDVSKSFGFSLESSGVFAQTCHALRFMESLAVCVRENEPALLVGETGCGKTTMIQQLALHCERTLIVQNLSLQTDSTDLLGGYRPLEMQNVARHVYKDFVDIFVSSFSRKQNAKFLQYAASMLEKSNWKKLSQCFQKASQLGSVKMKKLAETDGIERSDPLLIVWTRFARKAETFERQRISCDAGLAFEFAEGALVDAIQCGKWVLLDEINLASSDTLQRLCGLLDDSKGSITLLERGDSAPICRHPDFRLFAAMNPATDAGKKDLPLSIRSRFSELYVDELLDPIELRIVAARYLDGVLPLEGKSPEHLDVVIATVDLYMKCRSLAETTLADGNGHKPRYTMRTLSRALTAAKALVVQQRIPLNRAIFEGFQLAFEGILDSTSVKTLKKALKKALLDPGTKTTDLDHPGRRPKGKCSTDSFVLVKPFWIKGGPLECIDWSEAGEDGKSKFILTASVALNLRRLSCTLAAGPWPILLEGPTSSGKTTLVEYIAARCGHHVIRINNHEHTDVQEYTGSFSTDQNGSLSFQDGILVQALRQGHWVILDELNLAPSEVLEALNRLLDDNRELYLAEINEIVKPHPNFRLFATQNPSGAYGGRKPLSKAFRNRFVELYVDDIPSTEMVTILEKRCGCPPSHAKQLVNIMVDLRLRRSKGNVFMGKDSFITPRDLLRWAERHSGTKQDLAEHGYMLLAERLRTEDEKDMVRSVLEEHLKVTIHLEDLYYSKDSEARRILNEAIAKAREQHNHHVPSIAPTRSLLRLLHLVLNCIRKKEPVLLVGETGCGKTTVVQLLSFVLGQPLHAINCHATTETSDLIGGLRPMRGRDLIKKEIFTRVQELVELLPTSELAHYPELTPFIMQTEDSEAFVQCDIDMMTSVARKVADGICKALSDWQKSEGYSKKRKIDERSSPQSSPGNVLLEQKEALTRIMTHIEELSQRSKALFEWSDGPLVKAMRSGHLILLDEMSLAEDAVLERLNSVLEPSRLLVLAEKGDCCSLDPTKDDRVIYAHDDFRIFATMNPGGDYGKRELSPALRSRFTEIWVPSISSREDFEIVLTRSLAAGLQSVEPLSVTVPMLDYLEWFNHSVCGNLSSPFSGHNLSMRDVLSWSQFIVASQGSGNHIDLWDAFYHGACLMHLDGLGLGSGLSPKASQSLKMEAKLRLQGFASGRTITNVDGVDQPFCMKNGRFGAFPYFVDIGESEIPLSSFDMTAPTTSLNVFRVLRAMQLKKPILLEGPPGVGKTSLVAALAAASGHKLVRINLSEQTDMGDLMGNDLPVESSTSSGPSFEWCDGVLLRAIKEGSWVLLDELNLASQAVLEGLNSCLDHRGTVYIPEIGKAFTCPAAFRVFGAQNPLGQGGGRKGLPKSFLNRFTKVFVDSLTDSDFHSIVTSRFKTLPSDLLCKVINFNNQIHKEVVDLREYGLDGSPWEFNLRDIFRWSELLEKDVSVLAEAARDLFYQRFRTLQDRNQVDNTFQKHFGTSMASATPPLLTVSKASVQIGKTVLQRYGDPRADYPRELELLFTNLLPMEAVARCISFCWPCLLVGGTGSGKTSIVSSLAELCNATLVAQCLSPSSDVSELLGAFEQVESNGRELAILKNLSNFTNTVLLSDGFIASSSHHCFSVMTKMQECISQSACNAISLSKNGVTSKWTHAESLLEILDTILNENPLLLSFRDQLNTIKKEVLSCSTESVEARGLGHFVWRDGILVEAMTKGHWLVLENVNLCPASVLDRLNSVTERGGSLLLSESGTLGCQENSNGHRHITPHENFRIFLTMDPLNGEISRAMRNRCVEVSLLQSNASDGWFAKDVTTDILSQIRSSGVKTWDVATGVMGTYVAECTKSLNNLQDPPLSQSMPDSGQVLCSLLSRGVKFTDSIQKFLQLSYATERTSGTTLLDGVNTISRFSPLPENPLPCEDARPSVSWERRVLRCFSGVGSDIETATSLLEYLGRMSSSAQGSQRYQILNSLREVPLSKNLPLSACKLFLGQLGPDRLKAKVLSFKGLKCQSAAEINWMASAWLRNHPEESDFCDNLDNLMWNRLEMSYQEEQWVHNSLRKGEVDDSISGLTVLEASLYAHKNLLDASLIPCTVTRLIYPFFSALRVWTMESIPKARHANNIDFCRRLSAFLGGTDTLWKVLKDLPLDLHSIGPVAFEESVFITQWRWLRKRMLNDDILFDLSAPSLQKVFLLAESIDQTVFGGPFVQWSSHKIKKKMMCPLTPSKAAQWEAFAALNGMAKQISLVDHYHLDLFADYPQALTIQGLVNESHPCLYVEEKDKFDLLAALSTLQLSWPRVSRKQNNWIDGIDFTTKMRLHFEALKERFALDMARAKIDQEIQTVDNQVEASALDALAIHSEESSNSLNAFYLLKERLLGVIGQLQLSTLAEFWCVWKETDICAQLSGLLLLLCHDNALIQKRLKDMLPDLKRLVKTAVTLTTWAVGDMRPFQFLIWATEQKPGDSFDITVLVRSLLPGMLSTLTRHSFSVSLVPGYPMVTDMEMPNVFGDEEAQTVDSFHLCGTASNPDVVIGSSRLFQPVRSEFVLNHVGQQFSFSSRGSNSKFYTIENARHRENQLKKAISLLSSLDVPVSKSRLYTYHYVLYDILASVKDVLNDNNMETILQIAKSPDCLRELTRIDEIDFAGHQVSNEFFDKYWEDVVLPLLRSMYIAWRSNISSKLYAQHCALASIFLGVLRLSLLTPDSPVDPRQTPRAKVSLICSRLEDIKCSVTAIMLHSGLLEGNFTPETPDVMALLHRAETLTKKRQSQREKIIERMPSAAPFSELFNEVKDFSTSVASVPSILELVKAVQNRENNSTACLQERIKNWQCTAGSFCKRLSTEFVGYDDVLTPLLDSVRLIQDGFFHFSGRNAMGIPSSGVLSAMLRFPISIASDSIDDLRRGIQCLAGSLSSLQLQSSLDCFCNLSLALLARLHLKGTTKRLDSVEMTACSTLFSDLSSSSITVLPDKTKESSLEEIHETAFREQFPDHRKDFEIVLQASQDEEDLTNLDENANEVKDVQNTITFLMNDSIDLLYRMYCDIFSDTSPMHNDFARKLCFHCSYAAAYEVQRSFDSSHDTYSRESLGGHVFAVALSLLPAKAMTKVHPHLSNTEKITDFHKEACPSVALAAASPLEHLMARTTQLLTAFPGHSILVGLFMVCEKVNKLNLFTTPIGKVMTGMEVILRQAQDWEQHASEKVQLGLPLEEIGKLVGEWRRLELESWGNLLKSREKRYTDRAKKHWLRLHGLLFNERSDTRLKSRKNATCKNEQASLLPFWVWKGLTGFRQGFTTAMKDVHIDDVRELVKALDTFILTSPLGEFQERLNVLKACASELLVCCSIQESGSSWKLQQARATFSMWKYYNQYTSVLKNKAEGLRKPIEQKLKNETKLAKWDTQSYYALAESTERNQRKLMKILSEFDESMDLNVGVLIQDFSCEGLRSSVDHYDECCATFPALDSMFPFGGREGTDSTSAGEEYPANWTKPNSKISVDPDKIGIPLEERARKLGKYVRKMAIARSNFSRCNASRARIGGDRALSLCEAVFERIDALRSKSTRPMKERAVVDLFRELKWNGFSAAKWSTPIEVRQLEQIFLLPTPKLPRHEGIRQTTAGSVEKAEQYFMKCVSEMHALSSETTMLGSKYMTKRETELMVNFGYSGLMMLTQQRCLLSKALSDTQQLHTTLGVLPSSTFRLPRDQAKLCLNVQTFKERCSAAFESIQQLRLLVQTVLPSIDHTTEKEWARDVASRLGPVTRETQGTSSGMIFVTQEMLMETNQRCQELVTAQEMIRMFHRKCPDISSHLPQDPFEYCLDDIQSALEAGERCNKELEASSMDASKSDYSVDHLTYKTFQDTLSKMIESTLVCYQSLSKHTATVGFQETSDEIQDTGSISIGNCHRDASISATLIDLSKVTGDFVEVFGELRGLYSDRSASINGLECCFGLLSNAKELLVYTLELSQRALDDSVHFYFALAKLHYVILRVFRTLVSKGYCSDKTSEGDEEEGEVNGMTFGDDNDGTGMGEGDGKKDVTDQLENEDQLAGLKSDEKNDSGESKKPEQLNEEEADKGMEMEADFDGDMFDMPDDPQDKDEVEEQEKEEELDREMGDEGNADDQVVDEKMWDESDDEENLDAGQEKFEQDSGVEGDPVDDAIRTKEDQHDEPDKSPGEKNDVGNQSPDQSNEDKEGESGIQDENQDINDDLEELYEENHGVDVRGEDKENGQEDTDQNEEPMELGNDLNLDEEMNDAGADETNGDDDVIDDNNSTTEGNEQDEDPVAEQVDGTGEDHEDEETNEKTAATAAEGEMDVENGDEEHEQDDGLEVPVDISRQDRSDDAAHGIQSKDGADAVAENPDADQEEENRDDGTDFAGNPAEGKSQGDQADEHGSDGGGNSNLTNETANQLKSDKDSNDFPNPIKDPGDASKFWHRKLNVIDNAQNEEDEGTSHETTPDDKETPQEPNASDYQYSSGQADTTQVLGDTTEEEAIELEPTTNEIEYDEASKDKHSKDNSSENESSSAERSDKKVDKKPSNRDTRKTPTDRGQNDEFNDNDLDDSGFEADEKEAADNDEDASMSYSEVAVNDDDMDSGTKVVSDLSRLNVDEADIMPHTKAQIQQYEEIARVDLHEANTARSQWLAIQGETQGLARRLCEKVRLVLEPLVASKLRGDYRTGKRINMKRVIGYIASGYRKDKIWLRRTKPAKRDYRVLLAVDDSESMKKSGAGEMALRAMATVAVGMNQLEVGELGVASFGDDMKLVHPFHMPFTSESGADVVRNFKFDQQRTRISLCVESAMTALEDAGGGSSMQLVFLISDGRIERDSRSALKGLIREMLERNILLAMIIVEGNEKKKDSILNMKEVSFEKGKPIVKRFIEDYPFPYYIVLDDVATLPEVLGDALKQWFEILTQLQSPGR